MKCQFKLNEKSLVIGRPFLVTATYAYRLIKTPSSSARHRRREVNTTGRIQYVNNMERLEFVVGRTLRS